MKRKTYFNRPALERIQKERLDLGESKNHDYSSVADGIEIMGPYGVVTRMMDKVLRLATLLSPGVEAKVKDESIMDTAKDLGNYSDYLVSLLEGSWGKPSDGGVVAERSIEGAARAMLAYLDQQTPTPRVNEIEVTGELINLMEGIRRALPEWGKSPESAQKEPGMVMYNMTVYGACGMFVPNAENTAECIKCKGSYTQHLHKP